MFLSVVIPSYNQLVQIQQLLGSLELQTYPKENFEVIVSDDGSSDKTDEYLKSYSKLINFKYVVSLNKGSRAKARNNGVKLASGTHLLFLDGDLIATPQLLEWHVTAQLSRQNAVFIGKVEPCESQRKNMLDWYRVSRGGQKLPEGSPLPSRYIATNNVSIPYHLLSKTGGFNESYTSWGGEDTEMGYALARNGAKFFYLTKATAFHDHEESLQSYKNKLANFATTALPHLLQRCPEHGETPYLKLFLSKNVLIQFFLTIIFSKPIKFIIERFVNLIKFRKLTYRLYDYITYSEIYCNIPLNSKRL